MSKSLYLFVTSERPDPYVNAIAHCLANAAVDKVVFVHVRGVVRDIAEPDLSAIALRNVQIQMDRLIHGEYRYFEGDSAGAVVDLSTVYSRDELNALKSFYGQHLVRDVNWSHSQIAYASLRDELRRITRTEPHSLFDVTSVSKSLLGDIIAVAIIENIASLYTMDLRTRLDFGEPWRMLLHEVAGLPNGADRRYAYVNIVDTPIFRACANSILVRGPRLVIPIGAAVVLLAVALADYFLRGEVTRLIEVTSLLSAVAGLLSLILSLWPIRK